MLFLKKQKSNHFKSLGRLSEPSNVTFKNHQSKKKKKKSPIFLESNIKIKSFQNL